MAVKKVSEKRSSQAMIALDKATKEQRKADKYRNFQPGIADFHQSYADSLREEARALMTPNYPIEVGTGVEAVPSTEDHSLAGIRETMESPDMISLDASSNRLELLAKTDALPLGLDMAESIQAKNSLEKILAHQMAACHDTAMKLLARISINKGSIDIVRLTNASARLMSSFHEAVKVLHKIRNGNRQVVTVQHVHVSDGGQAVVSGKIKTGGDESRGGGDEK
jgi:hypothetical protein